MTESCSMVKRYLKQYRICRIRLSNYARTKTETPYIARQKRELHALCDQIESVIALLPQGSEDRLILEMRYIHGWSWQKIETQSNLFLSRSSLFVHESQALAKLSKSKTVQRILGKIDK